MFTLSNYVGLGLMLYAAYSIYKGSIGLSQSKGARKESITVTRKDKPVQFWISVGLLLVFGALLAFNIVSF
jgi:hypothetical protein